MTRAFLGLGSNLGDRWTILRDAVAAIGSTERVVGVSSVYETDPIGGPTDQGPFLNIVVEIETDRSPWGLLELCRQREADADRVREVHWGPRTLDVDVLWIDGVEIDEAELTVPHPRMFARAFVMIPLTELAPELGGGWADPDVGAVVAIGRL